MGSNVSVMQDGNSTVLDMLSEIDRGNIVLDLEDACKAVVQACAETMKRGSVKVSISFDPDPKSGAMRVIAKVDKTIPAKPRKAALFFPLADGTLTRRDPSQREMPSSGQVLDKPVHVNNFNAATPGKPVYDANTGEVVE